MPKRAISVTLDAHNLLWLRAQSIVKKHRSLSDTLDQILTDARLKGRDGTVRSMVGTVEINPDDPYLEQADAYVRSLLEESIERTAKQLRADAAHPIEVREHQLPYGPSRRPRKARPRG